MDNNNKMYALIVNDQVVGFVVKGVVKHLVTSLINALPENMKVESREVNIEEMNNYKVIVVGQVEQKEEEVYPPEEPAPAVEEKPVE